MKSIINEISSKYLSKVKTTKDLIYKDKLIEPNNIDKQYKKLVEKEEFQKSIIKYGDQALYYNNTQDNLYEIAYKIFELNSTEDPRTMINSFYVSEIQNSLWIEGIRSSKKKIKQILKNGNSNTKVEKEKITSNFNEALKFIFNTKDISEQNLFALYTILTKDIDMGDEKLDGYPYRKEGVEIGNEKYIGISSSLIKDSMDSIFSFIKEEGDAPKEDDPNFNALMTHNFLNTILIHYLFEIIHPYYDFNGRTGRLLSLWFSVKVGVFPYFGYFSEAINLYKEKYYYKAFTKSVEKDFKYDATYFVASNLSMILAHNISLKILSDVEKEVKDKYSSKLTEQEKEILISLLNKDFNEFYIGQDLILGYDEITPSLISKAFANLEKYKLVQSVNSKPKEYKLLLADEYIKKIKKMIY